MNKNNYLCKAGLGHLLALILCTAGLLLNSAQAQINFRAAGAQVVGTGTTITPVIPAGTQAGDVAVLIVAGRPSDNTMPSPPAGWSLRSASLRQFDGRDLRLITYYRVLSTTNPNPSLSLPSEWRNNGGMSGQIAVWSGVNNANPFDVADVTDSAGTRQSWTPDGLTTASAGARVVSVVATSDNNALAFSQPRGFTARMSGVNYDTTVGKDHSIAMGDLPMAVAGAAAMPTWTQTVNEADRWAGISFALRAAVITPPNNPPTISLTSPANNATYVAPATITLTANAADTDGTITQVQFFNDATLIGTTTTAPYTFNWTNVAQGAYSITARATDNNNATTTSAPVTITVNVNTAPTVALTSPQNNAVYNAPATIPLSANATDTDGTITLVEFFNGATLIGSSTTAPYTFNWTAVPAGTYNITVRATDNNNGVTTSTPVTVTVNTPPAVTLTSPSNNATYVAPASISLSATATDTDGTITQVQFFNGATLIGTSATAPYTFNWTNVAQGSYSITARATDNNNATTTSAPVTITVNANTLPAITLTSPANNAVYNAPATITLAANAADTDGNITLVEFFNGTTLIGSATTAPYTFNWTNVAAGSYTLTAKATDNNNGVTTSAPVTVTVNVPPTVNLTGPANNATFVAPASIPLSATAADTDGTITQVEFLNGATLIGTSITAPYTFNWTNVAQGSYSITARATDNNNSTTTSAPITITVNANTPPAITLTSPNNNASYTAPASISLAATATDDGTITQVEFYNGTTLIGAVTTAPYNATWAAVPAGNYTLTAKATDNLGISTTSAPVSVTVQAAAPSGMYFIHPDHLNTPRLITDQSGSAVWRWDNDDPFGNNSPNENPNGVGNFTCNLRLSGQYFDRETNLHYNYHRWYDPAIGRYDQSDPIGLRGGINTYGYVGGNPLSFTDPLGLNPAAGAVVVGGGVLIIGGIVYMSGPTGKKAIKSIAQKIQDLCTPSNKDPCDERQEQEEEACGKYWGHWSWSACMERARIRGDMCRRKMPDPPQPWSDADVNGWAPPRAPRGGSGSW